jgi:hypothetical protein
MRVKLGSRSYGRAATLGGVVLASVLAGSGVTGCGSDEVDPSDPNCVSTREYFTTQVYGKAMVTCAGCHTAGGVAEQQGAKFKMYRETYPDFVSANIAAIKDFSELQVRDEPLLLLKPLGERKHGGGAVFTKDSEEYKILANFVAEVRAGTNRQCEGSDKLQVQSLSLRETARKAAITLAGRYPTDAELDQASSEAGFDEFVTKLTREELFYDRLREIWNDALLTERGLDASVGNVYDNAPELYDDRAPGYTPTNRQWASASVTEEPMRFIEYVVRNDLPFSDVVAGNYVVANPYVAKMYGLPHDKPLAPESFLEWKKIELSPVQNSVQNGVGKTTAVPAAGVLTTPAFLNRWETTPTNKGRKRARIVLKNFLATDILKFAQRPVDSTALTSVQNPTSNSAQCSVCHKVIDPVAGGFRGFNEQNMTRFDPSDKWHDDMVPPGFNTAQTPPGNYGNAIMWLGAQIPRDPRFAVSIAQVMYHGIVGDEPLGFPQDKTAADYEDRVRAFNLQNDWFVTLGGRFVADKFDLRKLVVGIVRSPYFRAKSGDTTKDGLHSGLGQGRLLTPEMLGRKYRATTGLYFFQGGAARKDETRQRDGYLRSDLVEDNDWRLVYGGIDSADVTRRTDSMSPIMVATSQYTGALVACRATSYDFTKPADARRLFRSVEMSTTPFTIRANADAQLIALPEAETKIRQNIQYLFFRMLGETVDVNSDDVTRAYTLFVDVWKDLEAKNLTDKKDQSIGNYRCIAESDWDKPVRFEPDQNGNIRPVFDKLRDRPDKAPYEPGMRLDRDENFTVRSWQAVVTYLLTDYRFTHE